MNNKIYFFLTLIMIVLMVSVGFNNSDIEKFDSQVGDVKYSILPPEAFMRECKGTWVLLDGMKINDNWHLTKVAEKHGIKDIIFKNEDSSFLLPDARGYFFRAMDENNNIDKEKRLVGREQKFSTHSDDLVAANSKLVIYGQSKPKRSFEFGVETKGHTYGNDVIIDANVHAYTSRGASHMSHQLWEYSKNAKKIADFTSDLSIHGKANETRPTNLAFYVYIKVN